MEKIECKDVKIEWIDEELIGLFRCPECGYAEDGGNLMVSIYEESPYECSKCHTKFVMKQEITVYKLVEGKRDVKV